MHAIAENRPEALLALVNHGHDVNSTSQAAVAGLLQDCGSIALVGRPVSSSPMALFVICVICRHCRRRACFVRNSLLKPFLKTYVPTERGLCRDVYVGERLLFSSCLMNYYFVAGIGLLLTAKYLLHLYVKIPVLELLRDRHTEERTGVFRL